MPIEAEGRTGRDTTRRSLLAGAALAHGGRVLSGTAPVLLSGAAAASAPAPAPRLRLGRGANLAHWWRFPPRQADDALPRYLADSELALLREAGFTLLRLPVDPLLVLDAAGAARPGRLAALRSTIDRITASGLAVLVDLHPRDAAWSEAQGGPARLASFWASVAGVLSDTDPERVGFELLNEPVFRGREEEWHAIQRSLARQVRALAPSHTLVVTGGDWSSVAGLARLDPLPEINLIYTFHFYVPMVFTHQGADWAGPTIRAMGGLRWPAGEKATCTEALAPAPDPQARAWGHHYCREGWGEARLARALEPATAWASRHGATLFAGEFGAHCRTVDAASRLAWFADARRALETARIAWAVWGADTCMGFGARAPTGLSLDPPLRSALGLRSS